jgi:hypothetical protein
MVGSTAMKGARVVAVAHEGLESLGRRDNLTFLQIASALEGLLSAPDLQPIDLARAAGTLEGLAGRTETLFDEKACAAHAAALRMVGSEGWLEVSAAELLSRWNDAKARAAPVYQGYDHAISALARVIATVARGRGGRLAENQRADWYFLAGKTQSAFSLEGSEDFKRFIDHADPGDRARVELARALISRLDSLSDRVARRLSELFVSAIAPIGRNADGNGPTPVDFRAAAGRLRNSQVSDDFVEDPAQLEPALAVLEEFAGAESFPLRSGDLLARLQRAEQQAHEAYLVGDARFVRLAELTLHLARTRAPASARAEKAGWHLLAGYAAFAIAHAGREEFEEYLRLAGSGAEEHIALVRENLDLIDYVRRNIDRE